ncbi:MAG: rod shape-determining protein MreD [Candidatus Omnitrophica bacterium]|nr:rod shape-determining protein MreD [Candidatus Omnitrophota bacterium]MDD5770903.1 rod shape-determining protein MreD [Candidatus Omnitrophota bacterium]
MRKTLIVLSLFVLTTIQLVWPASLTFFGAKPDILLVFAVSLVFYFNFRVALIAAVFAGLLKDAFLPAAPAMNTVLFGIWSYLVFRLSSQIPTENNYIRLALVLILAVLNNAAAGIQSLHSGSFIPAGIFLRNLIFPSLYSAAISPLVFKLSRRISA